MSGLEFTKEAAKQLEIIYLTRDVVAQRLETIRQLNLSSGESVLDIGCGPGYLCESMGEIVGRQGTVVGIDISTDLIALCNRRKALTWLSYAIADATNVNQADASFDVVVCTQVAEYVPDVDRVLAEAFRVLKPGGRTIFVATDWDAVVWHSENLPRSLSHKLVDGGFQFDGVSVFTILNLQWDDESYSKGLAQAIRDFVARKKDASADDLSEWHGEFEHLNEAGRYFFSTNRYIFRASKPATQTG